MENLAILAVWLVGLFILVGIVLVALTKMVRRDTMRYDKRFTWQAHPYWEQYEREAERGHRTADH